MEPVDRRAPESALPESREAAGRALRVLVVDDHVETAESLAMLLQLEGYESRASNDGLSAMAAAREFRPDIVLLDISMPGVDGYQLARNIRRAESLGQPVLVAMSGFGREVVGTRAYESGIQYHLVKPLDPDKLLELFGSLAEELRTGRGLPGDNG